MSVRKAVALQIIMVVLIIAVFVWVVIADMYKQPDNGYAIHNGYNSYDEWVSPDGVHYWTNNGGYHAAMAPRYDHNGQLVIDK